MMERLPKIHRGKYVHGWLIDYSSNKPSRGYININNYMSLDFEAKDYRSLIREKFSHRMGYGGFSLKLHKELKDGDEIELYDENHQLHDTHFFSTIEK